MTELASAFPLFTLATITYNSGKWVKQAIESVLASSFIDFEYLISDDCSTDDTWKIIETYKDERIKAWRNENNIGEYPNRQKVLNEAKGKYIFYIDGDDVLYKDTLQTLQNYITFFPNAGMIWGIPTREIDFAILPYEFTPEQVIKLIYLTRLPLFSVIGFAETVFNTKLLKLIGGFHASHLIGDIYVKRKLALASNVVMIPEGLSYWRRSENQASSRAHKNYRVFIDMHNINMEILLDKNLPLSEEIREIAQVNVKISEVKRLVENTLLKGRIRDFFMLCKRLGFSIADLKYLFKKGNYSYKPIHDISIPLQNEYNFKNTKPV
ncbi:MAG: glycosyltransferase family 2 protein [Ginsengibacter sp.]